MSRLDTLRPLLWALAGAALGWAVAVGPVPCFVLGWVTGATCAAIAAMTPKGTRLAAWAAGTTKQEIS